MNLRALMGWLSKGYDFYKSTIVSTGSMVILLLALFAFQFSQSRALSQAISDGERQLRDIYEMTGKIHAFNEELKGDPFAGSGSNIQKPIQDYFYKANLGSATTNQRPPEVSNSIETVHYTVTGERDRSMRRSDITTFLQLLENTTTRARITGIKLMPAAKNLVSGARREDDWTGEFRITTRRRVEKPK